MSVETLVSIVAMFGTLVGAAAMAVRVATVVTKSTAALETAIEHLHQSVDRLREKIESTSESVHDHEARLRVLENNRED